MKILLKFRKKIKGFTEEFKKHNFSSKSLSRLVFQFSIELILIFIGVFSALKMASIQEQNNYQQNVDKYIGYINEDLRQDIINSDLLLQNYLDVGSAFYNIGPDSVSLSNYDHSLKLTKAIQSLYLIDFQPFYFNEFMNLYGSNPYRNIDEELDYWIFDLNILYKVDADNVRYIGKKTTEHYDGFMDQLKKEIDLNEFFLIQGNKREAIELINSNQLLSNELLIVGMIFHNYIEAIIKYRVHASNIFVNMASITKQDPTDALTFYPSDFNLKKYSGFYEGQNETIKIWESDGFLYFDIFEDDIEPKILFDLFGEDPIFLTETRTGFWKFMQDPSGQIYLVNSLGRDIAFYSLK